MLCKSLQTYWIILWSRNLKVMIVLWLGWVRRYRDFFYNIIKNSCTASSNSNVGLPTYRWCHNSREKNLPVCLIGNKQDLVSSSLFSVSNESKYDSGKTWPLNVRRTVLSHLEQMPRHISFLSAGNQWQHCM